MVKKSRTEIAFEDIDTRYDIGVDAKVEKVIMIFANAAGRKIVEDMWPEIEWTTDNQFTSSNPPDWRFTHIRIIELPPHLEAITPLTHATPHSLGAPGRKRLAVPCPAPPCLPFCWSTTRRCQASRCTT